MALSVRSRASAGWRPKADLGTWRANNFHPLPFELIQDWPTIKGIQVPGAPSPARPVSAPREFLNRVGFHLLRNISWTSQSRFGLGWLCLEREYACFLCFLVTFCELPLSYQQLGLEVGTAPHLLTVPPRALLLPLLHTAYPSFLPNSWLRLGRQLLVATGG